ncbi:hypothetical protein CMA01_25810 [Carnobacterium maltaromaticum]|nr:hypothetical protein CMA01_25810 [Carnobacterium maltaromaticum]
MPQPVIVKLSKASDVTIFLKFTIYSSSSIKYQYIGGMLQKYGAIKNEELNEHQPF